MVKSMSSAMNCAFYVETDGGGTDFEERISEYAGVLHAVALRFTKDPQRAEALVRQAVASALLSRHTFTEDMYLKSWLLTILRNTFIKIDGVFSGQEDCSGANDGSVAYYLDVKQFSSFVASSSV